jgi:hypothetical protein
MWDPRRLTTLWPSTALCGDSFFCAHSFPLVFMTWWFTTHRDKLGLQYLNPEFTYWVTEETLLIVALCKWKEQWTEETLLIVALCKWMGQWLRSINWRTLCALVPPSVVERTGGWVRKQLACVHAICIRSISIQVSTANYNYNGDWNVDINSASWCWPGLTQLR